MSFASICIPSCVVESSSSTAAAAASHHLRLRCWRPRNFNNFSISGGACRGRIPLRRKHRIRAVSENLGSLPDPLVNNRYHPSEEINESVPAGEDARLTDAETARTLVEVNSKATLMFSGLTDDEIHENIIWPNLPYLTDEHGDMYFEVSNHEDILQTLIGDDKIVQVIIGLDNIEMLEEMDISGPSDFDFEMEEITGEDSDIDDDSDEDVFTIVEDEGDDLISSEASNDWTNLETMQHSHPMYFARKIAEVVSNVNLDWMDQPSASIVVQGVLRPAFLEENSFIRKHLSVGGTRSDEVHHLGKVVEENIKEELDKDQRLQGGTAFYKLEMIRIQLVSAYGTQSSVEVQDFRNARPDFVVHHAAKIISQLEAGGDKNFQALKSLCWRLKSIQVEEATACCMKQAVFSLHIKVLLGDFIFLKLWTLPTLLMILASDDLDNFMSSTTEAAVTGLDSLGFDLRVCSGTQVQTLRFAFKTRATSELNAEHQLHDLLFPRFQHKNQI